MKKFMTMLAMLLAIVCVGAMFTSCDDDDDVKTTPAAKSVEGSYTGKLTCAIMNKQLEFDNQTYKIEAVDDANVKVTIPQFEYKMGSGEAAVSMMVPEIVVEGVKVAGSDGKYALAETSYSVDYKNGAFDGAYAGIVKGSVEGNTLTLNFTTQFTGKPISMPMALTCVFTGSK